LPLASVHIDGYALNEVPSVMLSEDAADGRPAIFGSNENEMTLFTIGLESTVVNAATLEARLRLTFGNEVADAILPLYPIGSFDSPADAFRAAAEDLFFVCPQTTAVSTLAALGGDAYLYHFLNNPMPVANLRSFHGLELFYVFDTLGVQTLFTPDAGDLALRTAIQDAWTSFADSGVPSTSPAWPLATSDALLTPLLQFDATSVAISNSTSTGGSYRSGRCAALDALNLNPDLDLVAGSADNCPNVANSLQGDSNSNGIGDACDPVLVPSSTPLSLGILLFALLRIGILKAQLQH
jgi:carboxylesterase type B